MQVGERWSEDALKRVDNWRRAQLDLPNRPEAIRRLVELGLSVGTPRAAPSERLRSERAAQLASRTIDHLSQDLGGIVHEQKVKLVEGPAEFRKARKDKPKKAKNK